jgi:hypothetical protein
MENRAYLWLGLGMIVGAVAVLIVLAVGGWL